LKTNIPFINRVFAILLSIVFCLVLVPSFITLPVELVLFNPETYHPVIEDETYRSQYPEIITRLLITRIYDADAEWQHPPILAYQDNLSYIIKEHIPEDWAVGVITELFDHGLDYLNFRKPAPTLSINTQELKSALILNSEAISEGYLSSLPSCRIGTGESSEIRAGASVFDLPPCKPDQASFSQARTLLAEYLADLFNRMPSETSIIGLVTLEQTETEGFFRTYSLARWGLRLLPLISISILILVSILLKARREVMFRWIGRMIVFVSGVCLFGLVILLIGFDQFIALTMNPFLRQLIPGFDVLMLAIVHRVGYQTIVWVVVTLVIAAGFGLFLIFMRRFVKPPEEPPAVEPQMLMEEIHTDVGSEALPVKEIKPETLEEVEESEKKLNQKSRKKPTAD
jgi:hypothetical protein